MARRGKVRSAPSPGRRAVWGHFARVGLTLVAAVLGVVALAWFGSRATEQVADHPRFAVKLADVRCDAPPGSTRETFLSEVRYLGELSETLPAVSPDLATKLSPAFALHPWVESVDGVDVSPDREVRVRLTFRKPMLRVHVSGQPAERLVDARGIVLPPAPAPAGVAELAGVWKPPTVPAGKPWDDGTIRRAAELAREFDAAKVERADKGWRITTRTGRVLVISF